MKKPHVLFVTEKYADANPLHPSNSHHNLFGSLDCANIAEYTNFFLEDNQSNIDEHLITCHKRLSPDLTVVTILITNNFNGNPTEKAFAKISENSPVVFIWYDTVQKYIYKIVERFEKFATLNIILDDPFFIPNEKFLHLWTPQDTKIYHDPKINRDIELSFLGSLNGYKDRTECLNHLMANSGINVHRDGGQRERNISPQDYANAMQRSKISLNFSNTKNCLHQTKGRLWEITSCGAMLMEDVNQGTQMWFEPYRDYVPFTSKEDLVDKANYYLSNPDKMTEIAANGKMKSEIQYNPKNWWNIVFSRCGLN